MRRKLLVSSFLLSVAAGALGAWLMGHPLSYAPGEFANASAPRASSHGASAPDSEDDDLTPLRLPTIGDGGVEQAEAGVFRRRLGRAEHPREEPLGVEVDDQDATPLPAECGGEVDRRGRLPSTPLVIADGEDGHESQNEQVG